MEKKQLKITIRNQNSSVVCIPDTVSPELLDGLKHHSLYQKCKVKAVPYCRPNKPTLSDRFASISEQFSHLQKLNNVDDSVNEFYTYSSGGKKSDQVEPIDNGINIFTKESQDIDSKNSSDSPFLNLTYSIVSDSTKHSQISLSSNTDSDYDNLYSEEPKLVAEHLPRHLSRYQSSSYAVQDHGYCRDLKSEFHAFVKYLKNIYKSLMQLSDEVSLLQDFAEYEFLYNLTDEKGTNKNGSLEKELCSLFYEFLKLNHPCYSQPAEPVNYMKNSHISENKVTEDIIRKSPMTRFTEDATDTLVERSLRTGDEVSIISDGSDIQSDYNVKNMSTPDNILITDTCSSSTGDIQEENMLDLNLSLSDLERYRANLLKQLSDLKSTEQNSASESEESDMHEETHVGNKLDKSIGFKAAVDCNSSREVNSAESDIELSHVNINLSDFQVLDEWEDSYEKEIACDLKVDDKVTENVEMTSIVINKYCCQDYKISDSESDDVVTCIENAESSNKKSENECTLPESNADKLQLDFNGNVHNTMSIKSQNKKNVDYFMLNGSYEIENSEEEDDIVKVGEKHCAVEITHKEKDLECSYNETVTVDKDWDSLKEKNNYIDHNLNDFTGTNVEHCGNNFTPVLISKSDEDLGIIKEGEVNGCIKVSSTSVLISKSDEESSNIEKKEVNECIEDITVSSTPVLITKSDEESRNIKEREVIEQITVSSTPVLISQSDEAVNRCIEDITVSVNEESVYDEAVDSLGANGVNSYSHIEDIIGASKPNPNTNTENASDTLLNDNLFAIHCVSNLNNKACIINNDAKNMAQDQIIEIADMLPCVQPKSNVFSMLRCGNNADIFNTDSDNSSCDELNVNSGDDFTCFQEYRPILKNKADADDFNSEHLTEMNSKFGDVCNSGKMDGFNENETWKSAESMCSNTNKSLEDDKHFGMSIKLCKYEDDHVEINKKELVYEIDMTNEPLKDGINVEGNATVSSDVESLNRIKTVANEIDTDVSKCMELSIGDIETESDDIQNMKYVKEIKLSGISSTDDDISGTLSGMESHSHLGKSLCVPDVNEKQLKNLSCSFQSEESTDSYFLTHNNKVNHNCFKNLLLNTFLSKESHNYISQCASGVSPSWCLENFDFLDFKQMAEITEVKTKSNITVQNNSGEVIAKDVTPISRKVKSSSEDDWFATENSDDDEDDSCDPLPELNLGVMDLLTLKTIKTVVSKTWMLLEMKEKEERKIKLSKQVGEAIDESDTAFNSSSENKKGNNLFTVLKRNETEAINPLGVQSCVSQMEVETPAKCNGEIISPNYNKNPFSVKETGKSSESLDLNSSLSSNSELRGLTKKQRKKHKAHLKAKAAVLERIKFDIKNNKTVSKICKSQQNIMIRKEQFKDSMKKDKQKSIVFKISKPVEVFAKEHVGYDELVQRSCESVEGFESVQTGDKKDCINKEEGTKLDLNYDKTTDSNISDRKRTMDNKMQSKIDKFEECCKKLHHSTRTIPQNCLKILVLRTGNNLYDYCVHENPFYKPQDIKFMKLHLYQADYILKKIIKQEQNDELMDSSVTKEKMYQMLAWKELFLSRIVFQETGYSVFNHHLGPDVPCFKMDNGDEELKIWWEVPTVKQVQNITEWYEEMRELEGEKTMSKSESSMKVFLNQQRLDVLKSLCTPSSEDPKRAITEKLLYYNLLTEKIKDEKTKHALSQTEEEMLLYLDIMCCALKKHVASFRKETNPNIIKSNALGVLPCNDTSTLEGHMIGLFDSGYASNQPPDVRFKTGEQKDMGHLCQNEILDTNILGDKTHFDLCSKELLHCLENADSSALQHLTSLDSSTLMNILNQCLPGTSLKNEKDKKSESVLSRNFDSVKDNVVQPNFSVANENLVSWNSQSVECEKFQSDVSTSKPGCYASIQRTNINKFQAALPQTVQNVYDVRANNTDVFGSNSYSHSPDMLYSNGQSSISQRKLNTGGDTPYKCSSPLSTHSDSVNNAEVPVFGNVQGFSPCVKQFPQSYITRSPRLSSNMIWHPNINRAQHLSPIYCPPPLMQYPQSFRGQQHIQRNSHGESITHQQVSHLVPGGSSRSGDLINDIPGCGISLQKNIACVSEKVFLQRQIQTVSHPVPIIPMPVPLVPMVNSQPDINPPAYFSNISYNGIHHSPSYVNLIQPASSPVLIPQQFPWNYNDLS